VLPTINLWGLLLGPVLLVSVPLMIGLIAIILSGAEGAGAGFQLTRKRWLLTVAVGGLAGCVVMATVIAGSMTVATSNFLPSVLAGPIVGVLILVAPVLGGFVAYHTARKLGVKLCHYRCRTCDVRFHARCVTEWCFRCAEVCGSRHICAHGGAA
jgi:hypothetical protein